MQAARTGLPMGLVSGRLIWLQWDYFQDNKDQHARHDLELPADNFSVVISGWPAVGKTTIAAKLAEEFGLVMYNGGDILKMLAAEKGYSTDRDDWWDTDEAKKFMQQRKSDPSFDKKVDKKLAELVRKGGVVITSYTLPWLVKDNLVIKLWLRGSPENRAKRMANRDEINLADAKKIVALRDEENRKIYYKLYGFRFGE